MMNHLLGKTNNVERLVRNFSRLGDEHFVTLEKLDRIFFNVLGYLL